MKIRKGKINVGELYPTMGWEITLSHREAKSIMLLLMEAINCEKCFVSGRISPRRELSIKVKGGKVILPKVTEGEYFSSNAIGVA